jgi:hypothetical protein
VGFELAKYDASRPLYMEVTKTLPGFRQLCQRVGRMVLSPVPSPRVLEEANNVVFPRYASGSPNQFSGFAMDGLW